MAADERSAPVGIDVTIPNGARIYDYLLGGKDNFAADRAAAGQMLAACPSAPATATANRAFLQRAVQYLAKEVGIRQFLDIGNGLPAQNNVHEIAKRAAPDSRVVYVDNDPVVIVHGQALLTKADSTAVVQGDLRRPGEIIADPEVTALIDFSRPVGVLLLAVLHFITDSENPAGVVATLRDAMAPGSHLVLSHTEDVGQNDAMIAAKRGFRSAGVPLTPRSHAELVRLLDGFELLDPGLVDIHRWRPADSDPSGGDPDWMLLGCVARKN
ncbi:SAM-dependent methyltransferase [Rhizohabitans arisaemae]|uniref:SAM-dependent methyltransferase n=1 Tax=Rhizohabitans arisaemae TaxID=2720610 RepID=UPI0024B27E41|nr:SAM-dependent methyltransferase [Rhizohabitans arisaemae]